MKKIPVLLVVGLLYIPFAAEGCALFKATGRTVEATGEGAGHAIAETGRGAGHAVAETGRAITRLPGDLADDARR